MKAHNKFGIYGIYNKITNKWYIGSSIEATKRCINHKSFLNKNIHGNNHLQASWNKYGKEAFNFKILQWIENKSELLKYEQLWIDWMESCDPFKGYNKAKIAGSNLGIKQSDETKAKRIATILKNGYRHSPEIKAMLSLMHIGNTKGLGNTGRILTLEHKAKIGAANRGRKHSKESSEKKHISSTGRKLSEEAKAKISATHKGHKRGRKLNRWPCKDGWVCKCDNCNSQRRFEQSVRNSKRYA